MDVNPIEMQKHLKGVDYPAKKDELLAKAGDNGASSDLMEALQALGDDEFSGPDQVMAALKRS